MSRDEKKASADAWKAVEKSALHDEAVRVEKLSDAELDEELAAKNIDAQAVRERGAALAAKLMANRPAQAAPQAPPPAEPAKVASLDDARKKRRPRVWLALVAAAVAVAAIGSGALIVANQEPAPPPPVPAVPPAPSSPAPLLLADALRDLARAECQLKKWHECLQHLNEAADEDPAGNTAPDILAMRKTASDALIDQLRENEAKTGPVKPPVRDH